MRTDPSLLVRVSFCIFVKIVNINTRSTRVGELSDSLIINPPNASTLCTLFGAYCLYGFVFCKLNSLY